MDDASVKSFNVGTVASEGQELRLSNDTTVYDQDTVAAASVATGDSGRSD